MAKEQSKTQLFQSHIQEIVYQVTGKKVSRDTAWKLYKALMNGSVEFTLNQPEDAKGNRTVSLAGVGKFTVSKSEPRGAKAGLDKDGNPVEGAEVWEFVPRVKFSFSSSVKAKVEGHFGFGEDPKEWEKTGIFKEDNEQEEIEEDEPQEVEEEIEEEEVEEPVSEVDPWDDEF